MDRGLTWKATIARYAAGNSRLIFSIAAAFAAPMVHLLGTESGGFNLRGPSSIGKSTSLVVAGSVWGGVKGYTKQWRATENGLESIAAKHYGTAARAFLEMLVASREEVVPDLHKAARSFVTKYCPPGADGQVSRVAARFGTVAAAGELAAAMGIVPWHAGDAVEGGRYLLPRVAKRSRRGWCRRGTRNHRKDSALPRNARISSLRTDGAQPSSQ